MSTLKMDESRELVFVYNARSGLFSKMTDFAHKIVSPTTYACNLCNLTHGTFEMQQEWSQFLKELPYKVTFQYRNLATDLRDSEKAPLLLLKQEGETTVLLSAEDINAIHSLSELIKMVRMKILPV